MKKTIILTTHNLEVANEVCNRVALLNKGVIIKIDTPDNLKKGVFTNFIVEIETPDINKALSLINTLEFVEKVEKMDNYIIRIHVKTKSEYQELFNIFSQIKIKNFRNITPSLEDAFLEITS